MSVQVTTEDSFVRSKADSEKSPKKRKHASSHDTISKKKRRKRELNEEQSVSEIPPVSIPDSQPLQLNGSNSLVETLAPTRRQDVEDDEIADSPVNQQSGDDVQTEIHDGAIPESSDLLKSYLQSSDPTCFYSTRISLYVSIPAIALSTAANSLLATHLAPLLLTYFPPAQGIVLAYSDPVLSAKPDSRISVPLLPPSDGTVQKISQDVLARAADDYGVCWVWLTVTLLIFRPEPGDKLVGWTNVSSEGFVGLVSYNYFQTGVGKSRIPTSWTWNGPTEEKRPMNNIRKGKLRDRDTMAIDDDEDELLTPQPRYSDDQPLPSEDATTFLDGTGNKVPETLEFRVVDAEIVPIQSQEKDRYTVQIDGTLLTTEDEEVLRGIEKARYEEKRHKQSLTARTYLGYDGAAEVFDSR